MRVPRLRWLLPASYLVLITGLAGPLGWITISADAEWEGPALRYAPWALLLIWSIIVIAGVKRYESAGCGSLPGFRWHCCWQFFRSPVTWNATPSDHLAQSSLSM